MALQVALYRTTLFVGGIQLPSSMTNEVKEART